MVAVTFPVFYPSYVNASSAYLICYSTSCKVIIPVVEVLLALPVKHTQTLYLPPFTGLSVLKETLLDNFIEC